MQYEFWRSESGIAPVEREIEDLSRKDVVSAGRLVKRLEALEGYSFRELRRAWMVKKVRGKLWEWRSDLKNKTCRIFFVVDTEGKMCLLEMIIKKNMKLKNRDIEIAEQRARSVN